MSGTSPPEASGISCTWWLTPVTPAPSPPRAPTTPATPVPWPTTSRGSLSFWAKSQPMTSSTKPLPSSSMPFASRPPPLSPGLCQMLGARSGWSWATPLSAIATTTPGLPVVRSQASAASMSASAAPATSRWSGPSESVTGWPVLLSAHWRANRASFGAASYRPVRLGSTHRTASRSASDAAALGGVTPGATRSRLTPGDPRPSQRRGRPRRSPPGRARPSSSRAGSARSARRARSPRRPASR